ncbi:MAG: hypothetical protein ACK47B_20435 [Armatimonadota bacterium]
MQTTRCIPSSIFAHCLWGVQTHRDEWRSAEISLGECLLLFTSLDAVHSYIAGCDDAREAGLHPQLFSRNRKEFGRGARQAAAEGFVGALFDAMPGPGEAPFLRFARIEQE